MAWPPTLADLKSHRDVPLDDTSDDANLTRELASAVAYVKRAGRGEWNFGEVGEELLDTPDADFELGTIMLASRWYDRRQSPTNTFQIPDAGSATIPSYDTDIERMCRLGRYAPPRFS